jgi:CheY-like chemotaxis protein
MPQPTGLDILRTLRGEQETKHTPVMVISNSSMQRVVDEVTALGADYIVKADLSLRDLAGRVERRLLKVEKPAPAAPAPASEAPAAAAPEVKPDPLAAAVRERRNPPPRSAVEQTHECAGCGWAISTTQKFCPKCGRPLGDAFGGRTWTANLR